jgi:beta-phosphoglucomutase-like phosphatase (HAD superfamily)
VILSDLDGVLVDSHASVMRAWRRWGLERRISGETLPAHALDAHEHAPDVGAWLARTPRRGSGAA